MAHIYPTATARQHVRCADPRTDADEPDPRHGEERDDADMVVFCEEGELVGGERRVERLGEGHGGVRGRGARMQRQSTAPYASR